MKPPEASWRGSSGGVLFQRTLATNPVSQGGREYLWPSVFHFIWAGLMKLQLRVLEGIVHAAFWCYYLLLKLLEAVWLPFRLHRWFLMHMTQISATCGVLQSLIIECNTGGLNNTKLLKMDSRLSKHNSVFLLSWCLRENSIVNYCYGELRYLTGKQK